MRRRASLWDTYREHWGLDDSPVFVWKATTREMNPTVPKAFVDRALSRDPSRVCSEYLADFGSDAMALLSEEVINTATVRDPLRVPRRSPASPTRLLDPSGGSRNSMTMAVSPPTGRVVSSILRASTNRRSGPESVVADFAVTLREYRVTTVIGDAWARSSCREVP